MRTQFTQLNDGWDAEPNAPYPELRTEESRPVLTFFLNPWNTSDVREYARGELTFQDCWRYRIGVPVGARMLGDANPMKAGSPDTLERQASLWPPTSPRGCRNRRLACCE